jgi:hypothetical protein
MPDGSTGRHHDGFLADPRLPTHIATSAATRIRMLHRTQHSYPALAGAARRSRRPGGDPRYRTRPEHEWLPHPT